MVPGGPFSKLKRMESGELVFHLPYTFSPDIYGILFYDIYLLDNVTPHVPSTGYLISSLILLTQNEYYTSKSKVW